MRATTIRAMRGGDDFSLTSKFEGMLSLLMAQRYYPDSEEEGEKVQTSVRLPLQQHQDILLIAELWNELDRTLGKKRSQKWKAASVILRMISVGIDGFWGQIGGRPETEAERKEAIAKVAALAKDRAPKK